MNEKEKFQEGIVYLDKRLHRWACECDDKLKIASYTLLNGKKFRSGKTHEKKISREKTNKNINFECLWIKLGFEFRKKSSDAW